MNSKNLKNKIIPSEIETACTKALMHYPELDDVHIKFVFSDNIRKSVMQAQPLVASMFGLKKKRAYLIKMSKCFVLKGKKIFLTELPEDVLVGWIGHELGHVMDYRTKNDLAMMVFGLLYLTSKQFIISAERAADTYAVNHGLGDYILKTKNFILHESGMSKRYIKKMERLYLPPEEIMELMAKEEKA